MLYYALDRVSAEQTDPKDGSNPSTTGVETGVNGKGEAGWFDSNIPYHFFI